MSDQAPPVRLLDDHGMPTQIGLRVGLCRDYMAVPYPKKARDDGVNHGYVNVKRDPSLISRIPEVQGWPELENMLRAVNTPDGIFCTIGCDATTRVQDDLHCVSVFVQLAFDVEDLNRWENYFEFFSQHATLRAGDPPCGDTFLDVLLSRRHWTERGFRGWEAMVTQNARAETAEEARRLWRSEFDQLRCFLVQEGSADTIPAGLRRLS